MPHMLRSVLLWRNFRTCILKESLWFNGGIIRFSRFQWPRGLRRRSVAARLQRLWVRIPPEAWISVVSVVCCQIEVSATSWSLVERSLPTVVRRWVWSRNLVNEETLAVWGVLRQKKKVRFKSHRVTRVKVKQPHYRPGQPQMVPGNYGSQILWQRHTIVVGCQPYAPTAFTPRKCSWYSFLLEAESTPGPIVRSEGFYINEKSTDTSWDRTSDLPICSTAQPLCCRGPHCESSTEYFTTIMVIQ